MTVGALVEGERRHLRRGELLSAGLLAAGSAALVLTGAGVLLGRARWLELPRGLPFVAWIVMAAALAALALRTRARLRSRTTPAGVALVIESEQGLRRGLLVGVLEMEGAGGLAAHAAHAVRAGLPDRAPYAPALRRESSRRAVLGAGVALAGTLMLATATPVFGDGIRAVLRPIDAWRGALLARPRLEGVPRELLRGAPLHVTVHAAGRTRVFLSVRQTGAPWRTDTLAVDARTGVARWTLAALRSDLRIVASDGRAVSDSATVLAADRPFVGAVTLRATYPAYLGRADESLPLGEPLRLPRGTMLDIAGRASVALSSVSLVDARGVARPLATSGHTFNGRVRIDHSEQLGWTAAGPGGPVFDLPAALEIDALADSAPTIAIVAPLGDTLLATDDRLSLSLAAADDHGLARVELRFVREGRRPDESPARLTVATAAGTSWAGNAGVDVAGFRLRPGEAVRVRAEVVDASPWMHRGVSRDVIIKRPTSEETREIARTLGETTVNEARATAAAQRTLAQRTDEAARAQSRQGAAQGSRQSGATPAAPARPAAQMSYENAEKVRSLAQEQRGMTERVNRLREATRQLEQQLKAAGALDTALARQLGEAQALLRQALTPELMAQMQTLESAAQRMSGDQSRDALRDLAQMQQRMREQLERSAEMLKRAAHEGSMQTLADQAKELATRERSLADSVAVRPREAVDRRGANARTAGELAAQTERLREQMEALERRLARDKADAGASATERARGHAEKSQSDLRRAANEMKQGESGRGADDAVQSGEQQRDGKSAGADRARAAAGQMEQAARSMQEARSAQVKEWKQELTTELDQAVQELMQLAREERSLEQKARGGGDVDDRGAQSAVEQGVAKANDRLQSAGKKSSHLSARSQKAVTDAQQKVQQATQSVRQPGGNGSQQASALGDAADALTRAAASLARDREKANSARSASGFSEMLEQMKQMAQQQGQINSGAQSLMSMPSGASSSAAQSLARTLARKQRGVAEQLEEAGDETGGEKAADLAREARQLADALDNGRLDPGTLQRQQQLFRRLLDAGRSLEKEEREDTGKREAKSAATQESVSPAVGAAGKSAIRYRPPGWEELRGLSVEERRAILDYFTRLNSNAPAP